MQHWAVRDPPALGMRVTIQIDSAREPELRALAAALNGCTDEDVSPLEMGLCGKRIHVHLSGPECYNAKTPPVGGEGAVELLARFRAELLKRGIHDERTTHE